MRAKLLSMALAIVLLAPGLATGMASFDFPVVEPVITAVSGQVTVKASGNTAWDAAEVGRLLASGDSIRTGQASKAELSFATGKIRMYENTELVIPEVVDEGDKRDVRGVTLDDGAGLFRIRKRGAEKGFEVTTQNIIAGVKGTLFAVLTDKARNFSRVAVYSGVVEVTDRDRTPGTTTRLGRGKTLDIEGLKGFLAPEDFEIPPDIWREWDRLSGGRLDPDGLISTRGTLVDPFGNWAGDDPEGDVGKVTCPPVIDNDGKVVVP